MMYEGHKHISYRGCLSCIRIKAQLDMLQYLQDRMKDLPFCGNLEDMDSKHMLKCVQCGFHYQVLEMLKVEVRNDKESEDRESFEEFIERRKRENNKETL